MRPWALRPDAAGNVYFASYDDCVFKLDTNGVLTRVAGNSHGQLYFPEGVGADGAGNLYIADSDSNRIRKVSPSGIITTIAGNGMPGYSEDGGLAIGAQLETPMGPAVDSLARIFIVDAGNNAIRLLTPRWVAPSRHRDIP